MAVQCRANGAKRLRKNLVRCDATRHQKGCNRYRAPTAEDSLAEIAQTLSVAVGVMSAAIILYLKPIHDSKPTKGENE